MTTIQRWPSGAPGRSRTVRHGDTIYTVANARVPSASFADQAAQALAMLEQHLAEGGSSRSSILSIQVLLADIDRRPEFDRQWLGWIGDDPAHWPQRAVHQASLAPGLLLELIVVAAADPRSGEAQ